MKARILLLTLGLGFMALVVTSAASHAGEQPFSIVISAVKTEVPTGSPVEISIRLRNSSNQDASWSTIYSDGVAYDYTYDIRLEGGKKLAPLHKRDEGPFIGSAVIGTIKPGKSLETRVDITALYDMTKPGKYIVQLSKTLSEHPKNIEVKSNKITITVTK